VAIPGAAFGGRRSARSACDDPVVRVAFLGLGLIGGSLALATRSPDRHVVAWTPRGDGPRAALAAGAIDELAATREAAVQGADLVILAAPPLDILEHLRWLGDVRGTLAASATVTDVASTKSAISATARAAELPFVGGHPMAGLETSGFGAADAELFRDRPWILTEALAGADRDVVERLALDAGARVIGMAASDHDRAVAAISHLPLVASAALVETVLGVDGEAPPPESGDAIGLAAGGWASMTRLARGDVAMATGIAATNRDALVGQLLAYRDRIDEWLALLDRPEPPDAQALERRFAGARERAREGRT
jgi:prephenate dehydrogenase